MLGLKNLLAGIIIRNTRYLSARNRLENYS